MEPKQRQEQPSDYARRAVFGGTQALAGGAAGGLLTKGLNALQPLIKKRLEGVGDEVPEHLETGTNTKVRKVLRTLMEGDQHTPKDFTIEPVGDVHHAKVNLDTKKLHFAPKSTAQTISHELGHASPKSRIAKALREVSAQGRNPYAMMLPSALALTGVANTGEDSNPVAKSAPYVGGLMLASHLLEEGRANLRGAELLRKAGWNLSKKQRLGMFLPTLTYLAKAIPLIATPVAISKGIEAYNKKRPHPKELLTLTPPTTLGELPATAEELEEKWF